jgi:hypothetical protein
MKRLLSILIVALAALVLLVPNAQAAKAKKFYNSSSSKYSAVVFSGANCTGTKRYLAPGSSLSEWVQSYRVGSTGASATYGGVTYKRYYGVCYYTSYRGTVTYKNWD